MIAALGWWQIWKAFNEGVSSTPSSSLLQRCRHPGISAVEFAWLGAYTVQYSIPIESDYSCAVRPSVRGCLCWRQICIQRFCVHVCVCRKLKPNCQMYVMGARAAVWWEETEEQTPWFFSELLCLLGPIHLFRLFLLLWRYSLVRCHVSHNDSLRLQFWWLCHFWSCSDF